MPIRLQDIAKDLNLSAMTISRVLRGQTDVSEETKVRVLQRMQELKYRPNDSARGLRTGQAFRVGMLVPRISDPYFAAACQGLTAVFQAASYGVSIVHDECRSGARKRRDRTATFATGGRADPDRSR